VDLKKKKAGSFTGAGAWSVFWLRDFWWRFVLTRRIVDVSQKINGAA
jgi:hypothetical protein